MNGPRYRIIDLPDERFPYGLVEESTDEVVRVSETPRELSDWVLLNDPTAIVRHDEDLIKAEVLPWKRKP